jgi:hypothetical protein
MKKLFARPEAILRKSLDHQLKVYSLAASAAGLSALALASPAEAKIVYTHVHLQIPSGHSVLLDLNNDGFNDFNLSNFYSSIVHVQLLGMHPYTAKGNAMIKGPKGCDATTPGPAPLKAGTRIGPGKRFAVSATCMARVPNHSTTGAATVGSSGSWRGVVNRYIGVKFLINGKTHYGWVRLSVTHSPFVATLTGYAYETTVNKSILAGKTKGPDQAPAISAKSSRPTASLGALALGAPGMQIWRREERAGL